MTLNQDASAFIILCVILLLLILGICGGPEDED